MNRNVRCQNMNHGRKDSATKFCPTCGEKLNSSSKGGCDNTKHLALRKAQDAFCHICGLKLSTLK